MFGFKGTSTPRDMSETFAEEEADLAKRLKASGNSAKGVRLAVDQLRVTHADEAAAAGFGDLAREKHREAGD